MSCHEEWTYAAENSIEPQYLLNSTLIVHLDNSNPKQEYTRNLIDATPKDSIENIKRRQQQREEALKKRVG